MLYDYGEFQEMDKKSFFDQFFMWKFFQRPPVKLWLITTDKKPA